jgi:apolipoprotein D and lipocalin family protein
MRQIAPRWRIAALAICLALAGCTGRPDGVQPVRGFDVARYQGDWFEIMRLDHSFERGLTNVTASYRPRPDGSLAVHNRGFDRAACRWKDAQGRAQFLGARDVASLSVTFFWPFSGGYHVFALDQQNYDWALVSGPSRDYLWLLSRSREMPTDLRDRLVAQARALGFPVDQLITVDHGPPACGPGRTPP